MGLGKKEVEWLSVRHQPLGEDFQCVLANGHFKRSMFPKALGLTCSFETAFGENVKRKLVDMMFPSKAKGQEQTS